MFRGLNVTYKYNKGVAGIYFDSFLWFVASFLFFYILFELNSSKSSEQIWILVLKSFATHNPFKISQEQFTDLYFALLCIMFAAVYDVFLKPSRSINLRGATINFLVMLVSFFLLHECAIYYIQATREDSLKDLMSLIAITSLISIMVQAILLKAYSLNDYLKINKDTSRMPNLIGIS